MITIATELAKAYVQIMPSADGIKSNLGKVLDKEMPAAGKHAGQSMGSSMIGHIKGLIATAGLGMAFGKALSEGAALQQSIGGIETLFKESADIVVQRANSAYKTAGMSANRYMELTTSFSASLLQSLSGNTQQAADVSDMAMTDMSDNANKMGTDLERITDAYQGFAKQNYTMLDNLKLGYGGTKGEMQRLLKDAQKFSGVKYDINNLSDVYQAIHVIQGELEITGTTAKEAATTFSGSFAAMKAAGQNVLADLMLGNDMAPAMNALAETATTFLVGNFLPAVWNILKALPGALITLFQTAGPKMASAFMGFIPQIAEFIEANIPKLIAYAQQTIQAFCDGYPQAAQTLLQMGSNILDSLIAGISSRLPQWAEAASNMMETLIGNLVANFPAVLEQGINILLKLYNGFTSMLPEIAKAAGHAVGTLIKGIAKNLPQILETGITLLGKLVAGIWEAYPKLLDAAWNIGQEIWNAVKEVDWLQLGKDIVMGLIRGIGAMGGALWDAAKNIASAAVDSIKSKLGIHSPSRVMRDQVGRFIPAGLAQGITDNRKMVEDAMTEMSATASGTVRSELNVNANGNTATPARPITMNVYGAPGQNVHELARIVMNMMQAEIDNKGAVFA